MRRLGGGFVAVGLGLLPQSRGSFADVSHQPQCHRDLGSNGVALLIDVLRPARSSAGPCGAVILACIFVLSRLLSPGLLVIITISSS